MEKKTVSNEGMENTIHSAKQYLGLNQIESPSEHIIAELRARRAKLVHSSDEQNSENTMHSDPARNTENMPVQYQDEKGNARSLQASLPCSNKTEQPKGGLSEQGDTGACRLHRTQVGR